MMHLERVFCGCLLAVSLALLAVAWQYTAPISYDPIGPRPYPLLILSLLSLGLASLVFRPKRLMAAVDYGWQKPVLKNLVGALVAMLGYALLFEIAGYIIATTALAIVLGLLFNGQLLKVMISAVVMAIVTYVLFDRVLDVALPLGLLSFLGKVG